MAEFVRDLFPTNAAEPCRRPYPGPDYWSWRCLKCGHQIIRHLSWWRRLRARWPR